MEKEKVGRLSLWANRDFVKLWTGQTISELGSHITYYGLPLLAVLTLNASGSTLGLLTVAGSIPAIVFGLVAGVWVDRLRRKPVMIAADLGRALALGTIPLAAVLGVLNEWQLFVVTALAASLGVFFNAAYRAYLPSLVERDALVESNSRLAFSGSLVEIVGPGMAGGLVQAITAPMAMLFDAISFVISAVSILWMHAVEAPSPPPEARQPALTEAREGLRFVFRQPILRALALQTVTDNFFGSFFAVLYTLYCIRVLHLSPVAIGLTIGMGGAGSVVGSLLAKRAADRFGLGRTLSGVLLIGSAFGPLIILAAFARPWAFWLMMLAQAGDITRMIYDIHSTSLRQAIPPARLLGRVNASMDLLGVCLIPVGALLGGWLGDQIGATATLTIAILGSLFAKLWVILSPIRRLTQLPTEPVEG